jgi:hypothetical protein
MSVFCPRSSFSFLFNSIAFLTNMNAKHESASPSAIQVKNRQKTVGIEDQLRVIKQREKGE